MRTSLKGDLLWHLHDLWPDQKLPKSAPLEESGGPSARHPGQIEQTARVRIARDELRRLRDL